MSHIVKKFTFVDPSICPCVLTLAICTIIDIMTFVAFAIRLRQNALTVSLAINVLTFIHLTISPSVNTKAIVLIIGELTDILSTI